MRFSYLLLWKEWKLLLLCGGVLGIFLWHSETAMDMKAGIFLFMLIAVGVLDYRYGYIFDRLLLPFLMAGAIFAFLNDSWTDAMLGGGIGISLFYLIFVLSRGGMGGGDVKYAALLGIWLGWKGVLLAIMSAFLLASLGALLLLLCGSERRAIPFGPFLSAGAYVACIFGAELLEMYEELML